MIELRVRGISNICFQGEDTNIVQMHPWMTKNRTDPLLSSTENLEDVVEPPIQAEVSHSLAPRVKNLQDTVCLVIRYFEEMGQLT